MKQIGKHIKKNRMEKNMTQDQLAEKLNVTRQAVSNWETGKTQPSIETLTAMASQFGISVEALIYGTAKFPLENSMGAGTMFVGTFMILMLAGIIFAGIIVSNIWCLTVTASAILAGLITLLVQQEEKLDILSARIEQLEKKP